MATWVRNGTGTSPSATDATLTGQVSLDNGTAPADFDPAAVSSVRIQWRLSITGIIDDIWGDYGDAIYTNGTQQAATVTTPGVTDRTADGDYDHDLTDSSIPTTFTKAQWEAMYLDAEILWATFGAAMKADGTTASIPVANVTVTITYTPGGTNYDETGKAFTITSTTTGTDSANFADSKSFTITSTVSSTDTSAMDEPGLATTITSTVTGTDGLFFDETGKAFTVTSTVTGPNDALTLGETGLAFTITSTTTGTDTSAMAESQAFTITSTVTGTDVYTGGGTNYDETGKAFTVTSTVTLTDAHTNTESQAFTITSTTTGTDAFHTSDSGAFTITSTVTGPNDQYTMGETGLAFTITSTTTGTDIASFIQSLATVINSVIVLTDVYTSATPTPAPLRDARGRTFVRPDSNIRDRTG